MPTVPKTAKARRELEAAREEAARKAAAAAAAAEEEEEDFDEEEEEFLDSDEEGGFEEGDELGFSDMEEDDEEEEEDDINDDDDFETKAAKYKQKMLKISREAAEEMLADKQRDAKPKVLGTADEDEFGGVPPAGADGAEGEGEEDDVAQAGLGGMQHSAQELRDRVKEVVRVLSNFKELREEGQRREDYLSVLRADLMELFEYNEFLMDAILEMFPPHEAVQFLEAMEKDRPVTIRTNTIKAKRRDLVQALTKRGMHVEPLEKWSKVGLQVFESNVPVSGTVEYLAGHYMVQSAVSFLPVMALAPQENERVLDMAAAPGGKTTYICSLMKNTGVVFANDVSATRAKALNGNLQRLGCTNAIVTNYDGTGYEKICRNFDRVLLDAPCTGTGVISRDKSIKQSKSADDILRMSQLQRRLLVSAIDAVNANSPTGGYVVYSTCSFMVEEDEAVVDYALRARHVEVVPMGLPFGRPGVTKYRRHRFDPQVAESRKFFPHVHNMDGFFVCKLRKLKDGPKQGAEDAGAEDAAETPAPQPKKKVVKKQAPAPAKSAENGAPQSSSPRVNDPKVSRPPSRKVGGKAPRPADGASDDAKTNRAEKEPVAAKAAKKKTASGAKAGSKSKKSA